MGRNGSSPVIFVYLRDGKRVDIDEGVAFAHRGRSLVCLDRDGEELIRFDAGEISAYGHIAYPYDPEFITRPLDPEERQPTRTHHRRRRRLTK
jgi:hypothetical protein